MANICAVNHVFLATNHGLNQLYKLKGLLMKYQDFPEDAEKSKLHLLANELGISDEAIGAGARSYGFSLFNGTEYRAHLNMNKVMCNPVCLEESTAWGPCSAWNEIMKKFPLVEHFWVSSEPANRCFEKCDMTGDDSFLPNYAVVCERDEEAFSNTLFYTMEEVKEYLSDFLTEEELDDLASIEDLYIEEL